VEHEAVQTLPLIRLPVFVGPIELLYQLIRQRELDITEVSLGEVADQFLAYMRQMAPLPGLVLAEFLRVAAQLMLLKARSLLREPHPVSEETEVSLVEQVRRIQKLHELAETLHIWQESAGVAYQRTGPIHIDLPPATLPLGHSPHDLVKVLARLLQEKQAETPTILRRAVRLEDMLARLRGLLSEQPEVSFRSAIQAAESLEEVIVGFLAVLELVRVGEARVRQEALFDDIIIIPVRREELAPLALPLLP